ncbi:MAG: 4'-phosphopantetheinyl transferase superfamily protein [Verrucomicrobiae bacterium]|nr:4'-phosphopantetheinyl transferase superfamily protein [Verrucomicrobiae bacterium]
MNRDRMALLRTHDWPRTDAPGDVRALLPRQGEVVVWFAHLPPHPASRERSLASLSDDERQRMARFLQPADQERFLAARGLLRELLGSWLRTPPDAVRFVTGPRGKPLLAPGHAPPLHFNVSHSGDIVAIALSATFAVGVDVEMLGRLDDWRAVADRIFSPREKAEMDTVPHGERHRAFLNAWTRKEAVLKASGEGLVDDLASIGVSLAPGKPARLIAAGPVGPRTSHYDLFDLPAPIGYVAALATLETTPAAP